MKLRRIIGSALSAAVAVLMAITAIAHWRAGNYGASIVGWIMVLLLAFMEWQDQRMRALLDETEKRAKGGSKP